MKDRVQQLQTIAPTVWKFLGAAVSPNLDLVNLDSSAGAHAVMGAAILLKARNQRMCAKQSVSITQGQRNLSTKVLTRWVCVCLIRQP